ncbi:MAG: hypothetical protein L0191_10935 [Acidobacteria bacterium]|nr:hypothetical protein [Acidobacteriota bacterium]
MQELCEELIRRRREALRDCSDAELEAELAQRPGGVDFLSQDVLPRRVEK